MWVETRPYTYNRNWNNSLRYNGGERGTTPFNMGGPIPRGPGGGLERKESLKSVKWLAVPESCLSRSCLKLKQGSCLKGVDDLCFHTCSHLWGISSFSYFSSSSHRGWMGPPTSPRVWANYHWSIMNTCLWTHWLYWSIKSLVIWRREVEFEGVWRRRRRSFVRSCPHWQCEITE